MDEKMMDEQMADTVYEPPVLVELGEFGEDTLGSGQAFLDSVDREE